MQALRMQKICCKLSSGLPVNRVGRRHHQFLSIQDFQGVLLYHVPPSVHQAPVTINYSVVFTILHNYSFLGDTFRFRIILA